MVKRMRTVTSCAIGASPGGGEGGCARISAGRKLRMSTREECSSVKRISACSIAIALRSELWR